MTSLPRSALPVVDDMLAGGVGASAGAGSSGPAPAASRESFLAALQRDQGLRVQRLEVQGQGSAASIDAVLVQHDG